MLINTTCAMACSSAEDPVADQSTEVILLRSTKGPEDPYLHAFQAAGFRHVHFIPVLHYEYTNQDELCSTLLSKDKFSGIVFTSQTAVDACVQCLTQCGGRMVDTWSHLPVFVVGKATAQAVGKLGLRCTGTFSGNAEALSKCIIEHFTTEGAPNHPLLFPCGNLKRETLPRAMEEAGIPLKCLTCYNTLPHPDITHKLGELAIKPALEHVWVVFFSPSGVNFALEHVKETFTSRLKVAAIGGTTGDALSTAGQSCNTVAKQPNPDSLVRAVLESVSFGP